MSQQQHYCDLASKVCKPLDPETYGQYTPLVFDDKEQCQKTCSRISVGNCQSYLGSIVDFNSGAECLTAGEAPVCAPFVRGVGALDHETGGALGSQYRLTHSNATGQCELLHNSHTYQTDVARELLYDRKFGVVPK